MKTYKEFERDPYKALEKFLDTNSHIVYYDGYEDFEVQADCNARTLRKDLVNYINDSEHVELGQAHYSKSVIITPFKDSERMIIIWIFDDDDDYWDSNIGISIENVF